MKDIVIMISGKARSGKDTVCALIEGYLSQKDNAIVNKFAFADKLKDIAKEIGWDGKKDERGRIILQDLGKVGRAYDKTTWIKPVANSIIAQTSKNKPGNEFTNKFSIITDYRFQNEAVDLATLLSSDETLNFSVIPIRIDYSADNGLTEKAKNDISEIDLDDVEFAYRLNRDKDNTIDKMKVSVYEILDDIVDRYAH